MHLYLPAGHEEYSAVPPKYEKHSSGYGRVALIDHSKGSVHMGTGICRLQPGGTVDAHVHANEKGIYVLEGELEMMCDTRAFLLSADDYALIPYGSIHAFRNRGSKIARWFEMQAPQPKPPGGWQDTFFVSRAKWPDLVGKPDLGSPLASLVGHFTEKTRSQSARPGLTTYRFVHTEIGAQHLTLMRGELAAGASLGLSDHPLEESYFVLSGEADMEMEGKRYHLRPGDTAWTGVGADHAFSNTGDVPFRWIETQAPQFPVQHAGRHYANWDKLRALEKS